MKKIDYKKISKGTWKFIGWTSKFYSWVIWFTLICLLLWGWGVYSSVVSLIETFGVGGLIWGIFKLICFVLTGWFLVWFYVTTRMFRTAQGIFEKADFAMDVGGKVYNAYKKQQNSGNNVKEDRKE